MLKLAKLLAEKLLAAEAVLICIIYHYKDFLASSMRLRHFMIGENMQ
jgi:hypothetical protein